MVAPVPDPTSKLRPRLLDANTRTKQLPPCSPWRASSASRGVNISPALNSFRILPVGVHPIRRPQARSFSRSEAPTLSLARSCRLFPLSFAAFSALPSFVFSHLQPLSQKHPGWGVHLPRLGALCVSALSLAIDFLPLSFHAVTNPSSRKCFVFTSIQNPGGGGGHGDG